MNTTKKRSEFQKEIENNNDKSDIVGLVMETLIKRKKGENILNVFIDFFIEDFHSCIIFFLDFAST